MNEVQIFDGLKVKEENGQIFFDAETVAIKVGLTDVKNDIVYVRWARVNQHLKLSPQVAKIKRGDWITEQQMYTLAIKTDNHVADEFQNWVTSEVLPSIRKTGSYVMKPMSATEKLQLTSDAVLELDDRVTTLEDNVLLSSQDYDLIGKEVSRKVHSYRKAHNVDTSNRGKLFQDLNGQIKEVTGAPSRGRIKQKDFDLVMELIDVWEPKTSTKLAVKQTALEV